MPGSSTLTIEERIRADGVPIPDDGQAGPSGATTAGPGHAPVTQSLPSILDRLRTFLARRSPAKAIQDYHDHPLNWRTDPEGRDGAGQMIRAVEGWAGGLDFCIVDLVMGWLKLRSADGHSRGGMGVGRHDTTNPRPL